MKQEKNTLESKSVVCPACDGGTATTTYRTTPNGLITSIQHMCEVCQGQGSVLVGLEVLPNRCLHRLGRSQVQRLLR